MRVDRAQNVYADGELAEAMYFVNSGNVKLYAENGFPFATFRKGDNFGEQDCLLGMRRNGSARSFELVKLYVLSLFDLEESFQGFRAVRHYLIKTAIVTQEKLLKARMNVL